MIHTPRSIDHVDDAFAISGQSEEGAVSGAIAVGVPFTSTTPFEVFLAFPLSTSEPDGLGQRLRSGDIYLLPLERSDLLHVSETVGRRGTVRVQKDCLPQTVASCGIVVRDHLQRLVVE